MLTLSYGRHIDGTWVGVLCDKKKFPEIFRPVEEALRLIKTYDPLGYRHLLRDIDRIWVSLLPGSRGQYRNALKLCVLDERFVLANTTRPERIASTIVHEATHARLMRCGIGYEAERRDRVEAICFRRQRAFAAKLPDGEQAREEAERSLTGFGSDFWTDEARRDRDARGAADALRYLGRSEFFIRTVFRLRTLFRRLALRLKRLFGA